MFERYTEKARRVIFFARNEAGTCGSPYIEPEHLLLGLLRGDKGLFDKLVGPERREPFTQAVKSSVPRNPQLSTAVDGVLSHAAARALAYAADDAESLSAKHIGPVHLLLGLLHLKLAVSPILEQYGLTLEQVREHILKSGPRKSTPRFQEFGARRGKLSELSAPFESAVKRLTPEIEPAVTFTPRRSQ